MRARRPPLPPFLGLAVLTVAAHLLVAFVHGAAHVTLGIGLSLWQGAFVLAFVFVLPLVAARWLMHNRTRAGAALLGASMALAGGFTLLSHWRIDAADHVAHLPGGTWSALFEGTAFMLLTFEIMGFALGGALLAKPERRAELPAPA